MGVRPLDDRSSSETLSVGLGVLFVCCSFFVGFECVCVCFVILCCCFVLFELFLVPASAPQKPWYVISCLWDGAYNRPLAANQKEYPM